MAIDVTFTGWKPCVGAGTTAPLLADAGISLVLPTTAQRGRGGVLIALIQCEVQAIRWLTSGAVPTAANGMLQAPVSATVQNNQPLVIRGENAISAFRCISATAGALITYQFFKEDTAA